MVGKNDAVLLDLTETERKRFWDKVLIAGPDDCWLWNTTSKTWGYGCWRVRKVLFRSNIATYVLHYGEVLGELDACHVP